MKKVAVIFAFGTEEIEALIPVDVLRRSGAECDIVAVGGEYPTSSHGVTVKADKLVEEVDFNDYDALVIPGGMPGATNIAACEKVIIAAKEMLDSGKVVASICASPAVVLANACGVKNRKVTCYPADDFIKMLSNCEYTAKNVTVDGNLVTANGPKAAFDFAFAICKALDLQPKI